MSTVASISSLDSSPDVLKPCHGLKKRWYLELNIYWIHIYINLVQIVPCTKTDFQCHLFLETEADKQDKRDSKERFPWQNVFERFHVSIKTESFLLCLNVCLFFPLFSCEGEVGMWITLLNLFTSSCQNHYANIRHMVCTVSSVRDMRPLLLMDSSTWRKRIKLSLMCAEWKLLLTPVWIHSPIGIFTFSCYSLECKPKNEVEKFNGRNNFLN